MKAIVHIKGLPPMLYEGNNIILEDNDNIFTVVDIQKDEEEKTLIDINRKEFIALIYETPNLIIK